MFQPVRGTHDYFSDKMQHLHWMLQTARNLADLYGFNEISTPIFEFSGVFHRLGLTSDIVSKETYTFLDRGQEELTLRPEGTAGVMRAVLSNGLTQQGPLKYFYTGPMFRYERPQKGRLRQFHHFGVELLGVATPLGDIEILSLAMAFLRALGIDQKVKLEINTIGDCESRQAYRQVLVDYFQPYQSQLSQDSQRRLTSNPLRILDSKNVEDQKIVANAPVFEKFLTASAKDHFAYVCQNLENLNIQFTHNPLLVRGLDYYCHTAFEFVTQELGAQGTVLAGGRYDGLSEQLGGPALAGVGWAAGLERLLLLTNPPTIESKTIIMIILDTAHESSGLTIAQNLRQQGFKVEMTYSGNLAKRLKRASRIQNAWAVIIGEDEMAHQHATVRNLQTSRQENIAFDRLPEYFKPLMNKL